ncbi:ABC transporter permease subunit [Peredibacter sp. HCB2-198]|uniref:ABC transporter permease subunit n=1 Tax=Peredibacter sp. HCB2-198 TaxID=3383025 RepID=UPI0038B50868
MIERFIRNEDSLKKWRRFKSRKLAVASAWIILIACFFSFTAEFWANSRPLYLKYKDTTYFPVFKDYHPTLFGVENALVMNYRNLELDEDRGDSVIWPVIQWNPFESNTEVMSYPSEPTGENWMGTDDRGRDIFARLLYGLRYSMTYSILVWILTFVVGTILGGIMGYFGGRTDFWGQRIVEVLSTVPQFFLLIIIISIFKPTLFLLVILSSLFGWISISYYVRGEYLKNRKKEFVEAAKAIGAGHSRIFFKHLLPNSLSPIITFSPFVIAGNITALASLDYLGFGLTPPTPSWGELLNQAQKHFTEGWWLAVYPSLALFFTLTMLSLVGEGVRDAMDPKE